MSRSTLTFFLLIVSFGILFAGCGKPEPDKSFDEFTFSDTDLQKVQQLASGSGSSSSSESGAMMGEDYTTSTPSLSVAGSGTTVLTDGSSVTVDESKKQLYNSIRTSTIDNTGDVYRVNNPFLNVRSTMSVGGDQVERLEEGDTVLVEDIPNAGWAKIKMADGKEGYVSFRYLAKLTTDTKLPDEKKKFDGEYYVDFQFLNMRREPSTQSEKVGELPSQAIVKPLSMNGEWARVSYDGKEGYISTQYLKPFQPVFLVRQEEYNLPILQYYGDDTASINALPAHVAALKAAGKRVVTLKYLQDTILAQETRDVRISPDTVVLLVANVNAKNIRTISDALDKAGANATLFLQTKDIGLTGITEKMMINLQANGNDLQSAGHTGDDLRSMTDSQVMLELGQSKKLIEDITHKEVYAIVYPKGGVNDRIMSEAADTAYLFGVSQSPDSKFTRGQFLRLPTLLVSSGMSADDIVRMSK